MRIDPAGARLCLGFACNWDYPDPRGTWSHTPWQLREALADLESTEVVDCGPHLAPPVRTLLKSLYARRAGGRWVTVWKYSRIWGGYAERSVATTVARLRPEAVLEIGDLARLQVPFYVYQDLSYDLLIRTFGGRRAVPGFPGVSARTFQRRLERQHDVYAAAAGVFCMSQWFADSLVSTGVVPPARVHVVPPGRTAAKSGGPQMPRTKGVRSDLLFVGRDFARKGGDLVVAAFARARRERPDLTLTVAGPAEWPLTGGIPDGVRFVGACSTQTVADLMAAADLFVMPSEFEAFGIVFVEALASGLPVIGAASCAMPEIIQAPRFGRLLADREPDRLAELILDALDDDELYRRCENARQATARRYSWQTCAQTIADVIRADVRNLELRTVGNEE